MFEEKQRPDPTPPLGSPLRHPRIEAIWVAAAAHLGWTIERDVTAYASSDGRGRITIGVDEILDENDAFAQLVFHELCHALIEGPAGWSSPDWGLCNGDDRDVCREHACLHLQVYLSEPHRLRELMAPTTEYRAYHDGIGGDPLASAPSPSAAALARGAVERPQSAEWIRIIAGALRDTRAVLDEVATADSGDDGGARGAALHPVGFAFAAGERTCGDCAWHYKGGRGRAVERCRQSAGPDGIGRRTEARFRACVRWEPKADCQTCGACCREAYHSVTVSLRDPVVWKQPALVVRTGHRFEILRAGDRCAALIEGANGEGAAYGAAAAAAVVTEPPAPGVAVAVTEPTAAGAAAAVTETTAPGGARGRVFSCRIYEDRPKPCREFAANGPHCLVARRRVGLSS